LICPSVSAPSKEYQRRSTRTPILLAVPEFDAPNSPSVTWQIDCPSLAASPDSIPNLDICVRAVLEMNDNSLELNVTTLYPKLYCPEPPARIHTNAVTIAPTIYTRLSQAFPSALASVTITVTPLGICSETEAQYEQQRNE